MSTPGFEELSSAEVKAVNEEQKERRSRRQKFEFWISSSLMFSGFALCFLTGVWLLAEPEYLATDYFFIPLGGMALCFLGMMVVVVNGLVFLIKQGLAEKVTYVLTVKSTRIVNSRDASYFHVVFEELPCDEYYTYHHNSNWKEHAAMTAGTAVRATLRKRKSTANGWFYPELASLHRT